MNFAVLGDIDGHVEALQGALDAIENEGIITVFHTGNCVWGPHGSETIALLRARGVQCLQGARDRIMARLERKRARMERELGAEFPAYEAALAGLRAADVEWLGKLPHERRVALDTVSVLVCHGVPGDQDAYMDDQAPPSRVERAREAASAEIVVSGGGHGFFSREILGCLLVNAPALVTDGVIQWARIDTGGTAEAVTLIP
jgi:predicted phosphodiesterase